MKIKTNSLWENDKALPLSATTSINPSYQMTSTNIQVV